MKKLYFLIQKEFCENRAFYLWTVVSSIIAMLVVCLFTINDVYRITSPDRLLQKVVSNGWNSQYFNTYTTQNLLKFYLTFWGVSTLLWINRFSTGLSTKKERVTTLMLPVNAAQQYSSRLISLLFKIFILFPIMVGCAELLRVGILSMIFPSEFVHFVHFSWLYPSSAQQLKAAPEIIFLFRDFRDAHTAFSIGGIMITTFFILGATIWPKQSIIYTSIWFTLVIVITVWGTYFANDFFLSESNNAIHQLTRLIIPEKSWIDNQLDKTGESQKIIIQFSYLVGIINLILGYFRLREMDIINRFK